jgi:ubiquitin fusion degradation protein 1
MLFRLEHQGNITHCGVLEFIAPEGHIYLPNWMMETLKAEPGSLVNVINTELSLGKYVKIQPQSPDFLDISDPKAVLENTLRNFSCLTEGDIITIHYNHKLYDILVVETKPSSEGICIVETDLEVDFDRPKGYVSPKFQPSTPAEPKLPTYEKLESLESEGARANEIKFQAFSGSAQRLNSRPSSSMNTPGSSQQHESMSSTTDSLAPLNLPWNRLFFGYRVVPVKGQASDEPSNPDEKDIDSKRFGGAGKSLRSARSTPTQP